MPNTPTSLFTLPDNQVIEVVFVQLTDGRIVPRTPDELAQLPPGELPPPVIAPNGQSPK